MGWYSCYNLIVQYKGDLSKITKDEKRYAAYTNMPDDRARAWDIAIAKYLEKKYKIVDKPVFDILADHEKEYNKMLKELDNDNKTKR